MQPGSNDCQIKFQAKVKVSRGSWCFTTRELAHLSTLVKGQRTKSKLHTATPPFSAHTQAKTHCCKSSYGYVNSSGQIPYSEANIRATSQENYGSRMFITIYKAAHHWPLLRHVNPAHSPINRFFKTDLNRILSRTRRFMVMGPFFSCFRLTIPPCMLHASST